MHLSERAIQKIEEAGLKRADTHWYTVSPDPTTQEEQKALVKALDEFPITTVAPAAANTTISPHFLSVMESFSPNLAAMGKFPVGYKHPGAANTPLKLSFVRALSVDNIAEAQSLGYEIRTAEP